MLSDAVLSVFFFPLSLSTDLPPFHQKTPHLIRSLAILLQDSLDCPGDVLIERRWL